MGKTAEPDQTAALIKAVLSGDRRVSAKLISRIESADPTLSPILQALFARGANTPVVGITGPPGSGKSTIADQLIGAWRARGESVAVLAIDPSSPISGGAVLGDRVRMARHNTDSSVFIRSMSARGRLGGLSGAAGDALIVLDAMGFDHILIETVGTGQNEIDIIHHADTVVVVQTPEGGDMVQAMKAGLIEVADLFVVNKMDVSGADRMVSLLREQSEERMSDGWIVPVLKSEAARGVGIEAIDQALRAHASFLQTRPAENAARRRARMRLLLIERLAERLRDQYGQQEGRAGAFEEQLDNVLMRRCDPGTAASRLLGELWSHDH